eukprot:365959-Chlamydomonas_euryale.AAC.6
MGARARAREASRRGVARSSPCFRVGVKRGARLPSSALSLSPPKPAGPRDAPAGARLCTPALSLSLPPRSLSVPLFPSNRRTFGLVTTSGRKSCFLSQASDDRRDGAMGGTGRPCSYDPLTSMGKTISFLIEI